ncbi:MAG: competence protein TfoX [Isosphaera sp.]|nr:competence protein TfoX [Isosphaera sp.]
MASRQPTVDRLLDLLAGAGRVTARKMFGEYCVYLDGKPVALVCDGTLYVKPTAAGRELVPDAAEASPYPGAKPHLAFPPDRWADGEALCRLVRATFAELPRPNPRKKRA